MSDRRIMMDIKNTDLQKELLALVNQAQALRTAHEIAREPVLDNPTVESVRVLRDSFVECFNKIVGMEFILRAKLGQSGIGEKASNALDNIRQAAVTELGQLNGLLYIMQWQSVSHN